MITERVGLGKRSKRPSSIIAWAPAPISSPGWNTAMTNEATAAEIAMQLQKRGISRVRPLAGGIDAWASAGLKLEVRETKP
jgi:hypothetical protein